MGVNLGALVYVTNQVSPPQFSVRAYNRMAAPEGAMAAPPTTLAIEPRKVVSSASVYAVFAID